MIYILLVGLIVQLIYCYCVFRKDLFSPSAIICEVFLLSTLACIYNISGSNFDIQPATLSVILGGNTVFLLTSTIVHFFYKKKRKGFESSSDKTETLKYIQIYRAILVIVTMAYLTFSVVFSAMSMSAVKNMNQSDDFSSAMNAYRSETAEYGSGLPSWLTKTGVVLNIGVFVLIYVFINNLLVDKKNKSNYLLLVCIVSYLTSSIFTAQRTTILLAFMDALFVAYSLLNRKYQFTEKMNFKYIRRGSLVVVIFLLLFGLTRGLFGRVDNRTALNSVTYYMGNSIEFLDAYIKKPIEPKQFGEELFRQPRVILSEYGLVEKPINDNSFLEFRKAVSGNYGNIYTGYRDYIHDFGFGSIILFQIMLALVFGIWYEKLNCRRLKNNIDLSFIFFAWFVAAILFRFSIMNASFSTLSYFIFTHWYVFFFWKIILNLKFTSTRMIDKAISVKREEPLSG
ncbi:oligosaccharide repeat unit polymerase [Candidatus Saccharibacteria bacterium]|nr:oligosaccharide repeat unit polymerase [Candidatus Saccharibacteria bacterium]